MNKKRTAIIAWVLCAFCVISVLVQTIIRMAGWTTRPSLFELVETFGWGLALPVVFSILAALIIGRKPENRVGWLMMLPALTIAIPDNTYLTNLSPLPTAFTPGLWLLAWLSSWGWILIIFPIFLIPLHFPTGRPPTPRWRWLNWLALGMALFFAVALSLNDTLGPPNEEWTLPNPIGLASGETFWSVFGTVWAIGLAILVSFCLASLFVRYRRAQFVERQQIKWLLYAVGLFALYYLLNILLQNGGFTGTGWGNLLFVVSILTIPVAIAIAILRYQLYDIDIIIRKTLVYGLLTALLALVYFGTVVLLQNLVGRAANEQSPLVIVLSTLFIAALFGSLRRRVQRFIDRRFYRRKYDAEKTLAAFAQFARDEVELEVLMAELERVIRDTIQPQTVSVWLKPAVTEEGTVP